MPSFAYMIGSVVSGRLRPTGPFNFAFDTEHVLGTAFIVGTSSSKCMTCGHVITDAEVNSDAELSFFTIDSNYNFSVHPIVKESIRRHPKLDVLMFEVKNPSNLRSWKIDTSELPLAQDVTVLGFAKDHLLSRPGNSTVVPRALKSYVVSAYESECEIDKPLITTMSGSPVLVDGSVVGIAAANRQYAIDQYLTESVAHEVDGVKVKREIYEYKETSRFGVFLKASAWADWANEAVT